MFIGFVYAFFSPRRDIRHKKIFRCDNGDSEDNNNTATEAAVRAVTAAAVTARAETAAAVTAGISEAEDSISTMLLVMNTIRGYVQLSLSLYLPTVTSSACSKWK